jgi:hypothetical protein
VSWSSESLDPIYTPARWKAENLIRESLITERPRYNPFNAGLGYVYVKGRWLECRSEHYAAFYGRTRKEVTILSKEIRKMALEAGEAKRSRVTTKILADHMSANDIEEARMQYFKDQALAAARGGQLGPVAATAIASNPPTPAAKLAAKRALNKIIDSISDSDTGKF